MTYISDKIYNKNKHKIVPVERPSWQQYFLGLAFIISQRSTDGQTKHGCIITDKQHHIIGTGFNAPPKGLPESHTANLRDEKYPYFLHSENNCLLNCVISPNMLNGGGTAYITGRPCLKCIYSLWNGGVNHIYAADRQGSMLELNEKDDFDFFLESSGMKYEILDLDTSWIKKFLENI